MIGIIADRSGQGVAQGFAELFKTQEFYCRGRQYEILLCTQDSHFDGLSD